MSGADVFAIAAGVGIELFEAVIFDPSCGTVQAPLCRLNGGELRRVNGGGKPFRIISVDPMSEVRAAQIMPLARSIWWGSVA